MDVENRVFVVAGGASGLGAAVTTDLCEHGAFVVIADINPPDPSVFGDRLGDRQNFIETDVTSERDALAAMERAFNTFGHLHGLVNCAGIAPAEKVIGRKGVHRLTSFQKVIDVNLIGTFNMMRVAADMMKREEPGLDSERGVIVNTASIAAFDGQIGQVAYAASKGGVVSLTLPAARELAAFGIRVVAVAPGVFLTPMMSGMPKEVQESLGQSVPFPQRLGSPPEFAALIRHVIGNRMINGETIRIDGALRMGAA